MRFTHIDVNFDVKYEVHQNCSKTLSMHILHKCIKQLIAVDMTLRHYDVTCPVEIHVDVSLRGLGAALF